MNATTQGNAITDTRTGIDVAAPSPRIGGATPGAGNRITSVDDGTNICCEDPARPPAHKSVVGNTIGPVGAGGGLLAGIHVEGSESLISGNEIDGADNDLPINAPNGGIVILTGSNNVLDHNTIHDGGGSGISLQEGTGNTFRANSIYAIRNTPIDLGANGPSRLREEVTGLPDGPNPGFAQYPLTPTLTVHTGGDGGADFTAQLDVSSLPAKLRAHGEVSATATNYLGDTSEVSNCAGIVKNLAPPGGLLGGSATSNPAGGGGGSPSQPGLDALGAWRRLAMGWKQ